MFTRGSDGAQTSSVSATLNPRDAQITEELDHARQPPRSSVMCDESGSGEDFRAATPPAVPGSAVDPITLKPVDEVVVTTLVDNVYDALLGGGETITRAPLAAGIAQAPQFESGTTQVGLMAEHGFSALVSVRTGNTTTSVLFDTGLSPDAMVTNADRLGIDLSGVNAVVLSHGHFDHAGGVAGLAGRRRGHTPCRWWYIPGSGPAAGLLCPAEVLQEWPTLSKRALTSEGFEVIERRQPSLLLSGSVLITGEVDRTTEFERGMPPAHQRWSDSTWEPDPLVLDDQALVVHVRGKGLRRGDRVRTCRRREYRATCPATDRGTPPACAPGRPPSKWWVLRAEHRPYRRSTHRHGARLACARALHRMASAARLRCRAAGQLGPGQQRDPLPTERRLNSASCRR